MMKLNFLFIVAITYSCSQTETLRVTAPDGIKTLILSTNKHQEINFSIQYDSQDVVLPSTLELRSSEIDFSGEWSVLGVEHTTTDSQWTSQFAELSTIPDKYNEMKVYLQSGNALLNIICRAYDEGVAIAYEVPKQSDLLEIELDEKIHYNFDKDYSLWSTPKREKGRLTAQGAYRKIPITQLEVGAERPLVIEIHDSLMIALAEAGLIDYARLSFAKGSSSAYSIMSSLDGKVEEQQQDIISGAILSERNEEGMKVRKTLPFKSPWRVVMMGENEGMLLENNYIIQNLNDPTAIEDVSWIIAGKAIRESSLTTAGGLAAIDFANQHNMQYVHFDAGWYGNEMDNASDATTLTLDPKRSKGPFDLKTIVDYANQNDIKIMLYVNRRALENQLDTILPLFKEWGISGIKYGFVRVGDQDATAWLHEAVKKAAEYNMIIDIHDEYRPTGFSRTYPNLLTQEGIRGDEETVPNAHTLITMYTRMLAGAADNTVCYYNKRVQKMGSRASQLAKTVCIFSPLQFLYWYDKPMAAPEKSDALWGDTKHIGNEPELEFFDNVPTTWDETKVLQAEIGQIGVIARRKGEDWFIGCINGNSDRTVEVDFSFLDTNESYSAKIYTDDETINTRTNVRIEEKKITQDSVLQLMVKENNGFTMHITTNDNK